MRNTKPSVSYDVHVRFWGKEFKPSNLAKKSGLSLANIAEPGEISKIGRYKGEIIKHGGASLVLPAKVESKGFYEKLEWIITNLEKAQQQILESAVDTLNIHLVIGYEYQCSLILDPSFLTRISNLNAGITFDAYKLDDVDPDNPKNEFAELVNEFTEKISQAVANKNKEAIRARPKVEKNVKSKLVKG